MRVGKVRKMGIRIGSWGRHGLCGKCGVYLITNTLNGKRYLGSSYNIGLRLSQHFTSAAQKYYGKHPFYTDILDHGRENFKVELLEFCEREEKLDKERIWYEKLNPEYNMIEPDDEPFLNPVVRTRALESYLSDEVQRKRKKHCNSPEFKQKMRDLQKHRMRSTRGISLETGEPTKVFDSMSDAARWIAEHFPQYRSKNKVSKIKEVLDGKRNSAFGFKWEEVVE